MPETTRAARVVACAVIIREGRFLLGRRTATSAYYPGVWDLFGGHARTGEDPRAALVRELREELGIVPAAFEALLVAREPNPAAHGAGEIHVFRVTRWEGEPAVRNDEHDTIGWFTPNEAAQLELADPGVFKVLERVAQRVGEPGSSWRTPLLGTTWSGVRSFDSGGCMPSKILMVFSGGIALMLGVIHLVYTFSGPKLLPRDSALQTAMNQTQLNITRETTVWRAWMGFNASHSMGLILFGLVFAFLALYHTKLLFGSAYLLAVGIAMLVGFCVLCQLYWFSVPLVGITMSLVCYVASIIIERA